MSVSHNSILAPVFIVGEARSGSSLLDRTLESHSSFRPRKVWHIESKILSFSCRSHKLDDYQDTGPFKYMLLDDGVFKRFLESIRPVQRLHRALYQFRLNAFVNRIPALWAAAGNRAMLKSFFSHAQRARGCQRIGEKTPSNAANAAKLKRVFPDCKVLYIHRHPVDVFSSYRKLASRLGTGSWPDIGVEEFCQLYGQRTEAILRFGRKHPADCMLVRYESFVQEPENEWRRICDFIHEPFEPECLKAKLTDRRRKDDDPITGAICATTKRWSRYVDPETVWHVERRLLSTMRALAYETYHGTC